MEILLFVAPIGASIVVAVLGYLLRIFESSRLTGVALVSAGWHCFVAWIVLLVASNTLSRIGAVVHPILGVSLVIFVLGVGGSLLMVGAQTAVDFPFRSRTLPENADLVRFGRWRAGGIMGLRVLGFYGVLGTVLLLFTALPRAAG